MANIMCKAIWRWVEWLISLPSRFDAYAHDKIFRALGLDPNRPNLPPRLPPIGFDEEFIFIWANRNTSSQLRAARIRLNGGEFTKRDWHRLLRRDTCCLRCGSTDHLSMDHIVPVALGGKHSFSNAQVLCKSCNSWKHTKIIDYRKKNRS